MVSPFAKEISLGLIFRLFFLYRLKENGNDLPAPQERRREHTYQKAKACAKTNEYLRASDFQIRMLTCEKSIMRNNNNINLQAYVEPS